VTGLYSIPHGNFYTSMLRGLSYGELVSPHDIAYVSKINHVVKCLYDLICFPRHILKIFQTSLLESSKYFLNVG